MCWKFVIFVKVFPQYVHVLTFLLEDGVPNEKRPLHMPFLTTMFIDHLWSNLQRPNSYFGNTQPMQHLFNLLNTKVKVTRSQIMELREKVLSEGMHMWNMKALVLTVHTLRPRLKLFFKTRSNFKVKVTRWKIMEWCKRSCHKEYTCEICKACLSGFISYDEC